MMELIGRKILVTGGGGFLGSALIRNLIRRGVKPDDISVPRSRLVDLRKWENCLNITLDKDIVIHVAGKGGGIGYNQRYPGSILFDNIMMGVQLFEAARLNGISKFVTIGTVCSYPKYTPIPFQEKDLWNGYPEETNAAYGLSKKILLVQGHAYRSEYQFNSIHLLLVNLYGPGDDFSNNKSHVIPALIKKMDHARANNEDKVVLWGSGSPSREFLYVDDAAEGICLATMNYDKDEPVNIGSGKEITIYDLAHKIAELVQYKGQILWDTNKPDGQPKRLLDTKRAETEFGFRASTSFDAGLTKTILWFYDNYRILHRT